MGRFTMAAKHHQSIAEMYENEAVDLVGTDSLYQNSDCLYKLLLFDQ